jgi:luciferase family oxidoreductase group 1
VRAVPGAGLDVPVWILGSSLFGAQLAAMLGLPFAFASHFAPAQLMDAIAIYRARFQASAHLDKPYLMCGLTAIAADTDAAAKRLFSSQQLAFISLRTGNPIPLPAPVDEVEKFIDPRVLRLLDEVTSRSVVGAPSTVREGVKDFIERTQADELMITTPVFDHAARIHSYELVARIRDEA